MKYPAILPGKRTGARLCARPLLSLLFLSALWMLLPWPLVGAEERPLVLGEKEVWGYAETLLEKGEYYRAVSEYRRLVHFFPAGSLAPQASLRIGEALLLGDEPGQALRHFDLLLDDPTRTDQARTDQARTDQLYTDQLYTDQLYYMRGLGWLELERGRPYPLRLDSISKGLLDFKLISPDWPGREKTAAFVEALENPPELPRKSPWLAGGFSALLPGSGSFYVGRYAEGSLALFVNALLIYSTADALEHEKEGLALVLGSLAVAFYGGSIYAAANGAHKFNDRAKTAYLEKQRLTFGITLDNGGLGGAFRQSF